MYISFNKKLGFIHIPKSGGTTMTKIFYDNLTIGDYLIGGYNSEKNLYFYEQKFKISKHSSLRQLSELGYLKKYFLDFFWLAIFREPIDRIKSVYKYCRQYSNLYKDFKNFNNINEFISSEFFFKSNGIGNVFAPQSQFINCSEKINLKIIKLENSKQISEFLKTFNIKYNAEIRENVSNYSGNLSISDFNIKRIEKKYNKDIEIYKNI